MLGLSAASSLLFATGVAALCPPHISPVLRRGTPKDAGLLPQPLLDMVENVTAYTRPDDYGAASRGAVRPLEPGSANIVARNGIIVSEFATGKRNLYADTNGTRLPENQQEDATLDTLYDMASVSKLFATVTLLREVEAGHIELEAPVAKYIPEFGANGKENVTILHLMTHTSGLLPLPEPQFWFAQYNGSLNAMYNYIVNSGLVDPPGTKYVYSDIGLMTVRFLLEHIKGVNFDWLVYSWTIPMGLNSTHYNRGNTEGHLNPFHGRIAPTEFQFEAQGPIEPDRPQPVRGTVHDENTWALGGVSGHAGVFSTVADIAAFCQMILNNGTYNGYRVLAPSTIDLLFVNFNEVVSPDNGYSVGFAINSTSFMGPMASADTIGYTGFTGTSIVIDRPTHSFWIHLANRVHPSRHWSTNNPVRRAMGYWVAKSLGRNVAFPAI